MSRTTRTALRWAAISAALVTALAANVEGAAAAIHPGPAQVITTDVPIQSGNANGGYLSCPQGKRAISGGAFFHRRNEGPDATLAFRARLTSSTVTTDGKGWYASGHYLPYPGTLYLRIVVTCLPRASVGAYTLRTLDLVPPTEGLVAQYLSCPAGKLVVTGGAFWYRPVDGGPDATAETGYILSSTATTDGKGWYASGVTADINQRLRLVVLCRPALKVGDYTLKQLTLRRPDIGPLGNYLRCPRGQRAVAGGAFWVKPGVGPFAVNLNLWLTSSTVTTDGKGWYADGYMGRDGDVRLRIVALCLPA